MKFQTTAILCLPVASAFMQMPQRPRFGTLLNSDVVTGFEGKAATSFEEDLALTLKIIMAHDSRSTTVSKEQFISQMKEASEIEDVEVDVSIPYDAPAKLAYEASDKSMEYSAFKTKYEADAVADVIAKQPAKEVKEETKPKAERPKAVKPESYDVSIPYDAPAKLAYEASDKSVEYSAFKATYEADAVADVIAKLTRR